MCNSYRYIKHKVSSHAKNNFDSVKMYLFIIALFTTLTDLLTEVQLQNHCMKKKKIHGAQHTEMLFDFISKMMNFVRARIQPLICIGLLSMPIEENCTSNF